MLGTMNINGVGTVSEVRNHTFDNGDKVTNLRLTLGGIKKDGERFETFHSVTCNGELAVKAGDLVYFQGFPRVREYDKKDGGKGFSLETHGTVRVLSEATDIVL